MQQTRTAFLAGLLLVPALLGADKPATPGEQLEALKKEIETARRELLQNYQQAKSPEEKQKLLTKRDEHNQRCAHRALELAQKNPKDPAAVDALCLILNGGMAHRSVGAEAETAFDLLRKRYITSDKLRQVCLVAFIFDQISMQPTKFLREVIEKNPHRAIQAQACYTLARVLRRQADRAEQVRDEAVAKKWEQFMNPEVLKEAKASDPEKLSQEAEKLLERILTKYADVKSSRGTLGEQAKTMLFEMHSLVIGKTAPEIEGEDIDGQHFKLSDYRGKVVVLDFWGNW
jgi:hypothetical protein